MNEHLKIVMIDDDEDEYFILKELISGHTTGRILYHYDLDWVSTYEEGIRAFADCKYDLYLVDYQLGSHSGLDLLGERVAQACDAPVIMLTGQGNYAIDVSAMQLGVSDYLEKGQLTLPLLERSIRYALERQQAEKQLEVLVQERTRDLALMKKQAQELAALQKATSSLLQTLDLSRLMGQILDAAREAIPSAERARLHLVERQDGRGKKLTEISLNDPRIHRIKLPDEIRGPLKDISEGHSLLVADLQAEPVLLSFVENAAARHDVRSAILAPLVLDQEVLGALSLSSTLPSVFSEADLRLLSSFAATATAAIHNAILYSETQSLAITDPLTGELNRRALYEIGQREIERFRRFGRPLSWVMFDIDLFKQINDTYGHAIGDQVLVTIVERCCHVVRHIDTVGRYGGDEFVILLPETDHQTAGEIADRVRTSIGDTPVMTDVGPISVSVSMGVTEATQDTADLGILLNKVDQALYRSKRSGRNRITVLI